VPVPVPVSYGRFVSVTDLYVPNEDGTKDHCYISKSYDATSHFETTTDDVKDIYRRIVGKPLVVKEKLRPTQVPRIPFCTLSSLHRTILPVVIYILPCTRLCSPANVFVRGVNRQEEEQNSFSV